MATCEAARDYRPVRCVLGSWMSVDYHVAIARDGRVGRPLYAFQIGFPFILGVVVARDTMTARYGFAICVAALAVTTIAALQYLFPSGPWTSAAIDPFAHDIVPGVRALSSRSSSTLGDPVALGQFAVLTFPFVTRLAVQRTSGTRWLARAAGVGLVVASCSLKREWRCSLLEQPFFRG